MKLSSLLPLAFWGQAVNALSPAEWRKQSIYFLLTDRFGRTDNSTSATCNVDDRVSQCQRACSPKGLLHYTNCIGLLWRHLAGHHQPCKSELWAIGPWWTRRPLTGQLDYIQGMGFTAIWITPVTGQFYESTGDGTSYHGYWQQDIYALNPQLGTASDLQALATALHSRGMYLMVDVVANHMGYDGAGTSVDYSVFDAFPSSSYFHSYCEISDYDNQSNVEDCWLGDSTVSLPDLNTDLASVQSIWYSWVEGLVSNYSSACDLHMTHYNVGTIY